MIAVRPPAAVSIAMRAGRRGIGTTLVGEVVPNDGGPRYVEGPDAR